MAYAYIETWYNDNGTMRQQLGSDGTTVIMNPIGSKALNNRITSHVEHIKSLSKNIKTYLTNGCEARLIVNKTHIRTIKIF